MNMELISLVLSLMGDIPIPMNRVKPAQMPPAVYVSWAEPKTYTYPCADPSSGIDPMGQPVWVSQTVRTSEGASVTASMPVMIYPDTKECTAHVKDLHKAIMASEAAADQAKAKCDTDGCTDWTVRPATDEEVGDYALTSRGWKIDHYPGGDMFRYPEGVFEVYPKDERSFNEPLGQGNSELKAIADALKKHP